MAGKKEIWHLTHFIKQDAITSLGQPVTQLINNSSITLENINDLKTSHQQRLRKPYALATVN